MKTLGSIIYISILIAITQSSLYSKNYNNISQIDQVVRTMFQDSKGTYWFGTESGLLKLENDSLIMINTIKDKNGQDVTIKAIDEGNDGKLWVAYHGGISSIDNRKVVNYYESDGLISKDVWCLEVDSKGIIWLGTYKGACKFDGKEFTKFDLPEGIIDGSKGVSSSKMVHSIKEDSNHDLWFSTNAGLLKFTDDKLINVSKELGIKTPFINQILELDTKEVLISTSEALYKLSGNNLENISKDIQEIGKGAGAVINDNNGKIWFVFNQHQLYTYYNKVLIEYKKAEDNKGPVIFEIYKDQSDRLWFVGFGGAYRLKNDKFIHITNNGPW